MMCLYFFQESSLKYVFAHSSTPIVSAVQGQSVHVPIKTCCKKKWCKNINPEDRKNIFKSFSNLNGMVEKQKFLENAITSVRHTSKEKNFHHIYHVFVKNLKLRICKKQLMSILRVTDMQIRMVIADMKGNSSMNIYPRRYM